MIYCMMNYCIVAYIDDMLFKIVFKDVKRRCISHDR